MSVSTCGICGLVLPFEFMEYHMIIHDLVSSARLAAMAAAPVQASSESEADDEGRGESVSTEDTMTIVQELARMPPQSVIGMGTDSDDGFPSMFMASELNSGPSMFMTYFAVYPDSDSDTQQSSTTSAAAMAMTATEVNEALDTVPDAQALALPPDELCPVCLDAMHEMKNGVLSRVRACGHTFCERCITRWLLRARSCPVCKMMLG